MWVVGKKALETCLPKEKRIKKNGNKTKFNQRMEGWKGRRGAKNKNENKNKPLSLESGE